MNGKCASEIERVASLHVLIRGHNHIPCDMREKLFAYKSQHECEQIEHRIECMCLMTLQRGWKKKCATDSVCSRDLTLKFILWLIRYIIIGVAVMRSSCPNVFTLLAQQRYHWHAHLYLSMCQINICQPLCVRRANRLSRTRSTSAATENENYDPE